MRRVKLLAVRLLGRLVLFLTRREPGIGPVRYFRPDGTECSAEAWRRSL